jgi:hypothetical protein
VNRIERTVRQVLETAPKLQRARGALRDDEPVFRRRALALTKRVARSVVRAPRDQRRLVLIFGCQRSGTTMLQQTVLDRSWRVLIIEEHDRLLIGNTGQADETQWQDYPTVLERLRRFPFEVVVAKPLVESSRAVELMDAADPVKAIWMLRRFDAVAESNVKRFGLDNPFRDLEPFCENDQLNWRSRGSTEETRETVKKLVGEGLAPLDAAALFWWARNRLYFEQRLWEDERIKVVRYERACNHPDAAVAALSGYIGIALPADAIATKMRPQPDHKEVATLHPGVERLCREMWDSFAGCPEL